MKAVHDINAESMMDIKNENALEKGRTNMRRKSKSTSNHFVYVLRCRDGALYTGYTIDPARRLEQHNQGKASKFTRSRLPVELVYLERFDSKSEALRREISVKRLSRKDKLKIIPVEKSSLAKLPNKF